MNAEIKQQWVAALRSGLYRQGRNSLRRKGEHGDEFCCLGVLCDILNPLGWVEHKRDHNLFSFSMNGESCTGWLVDNVSTNVNLHFHDQTNLMHMNDEGLTFVEIADFIERKL